MALDRGVLAQLLLEVEIACVSGDLGDCEVQSGTFCVSVVSFIWAFV